MGVNRIQSLLCCSFLLAYFVEPTLVGSSETSRVEILIERVERVSREEVHFQLKVTNRLDRPVFLSGIKYESERHLYPVYLEQWRGTEGWKIVVPCMDVPPSDVIKLDPGETMILAPVLQLPLPSVCKVRVIQFEGKFRFRLEYFNNEKQARAYIRKLFSQQWRQAQAPTAVSEPFEIPPEPAARAR
jgi:hypothetical protein